MSRSLVEGGWFSTHKKCDNYTLMGVDGNPFTARDGRVDEETKPTGSYPTRLFHIVGMATHDTILGMPWLKEHNPEVDRKERVLKSKDAIMRLQFNIRWAKMLELSIIDTGSTFCVGKYLLRHIYPRD